MSVMEDKVAQDAGMLDEVELPVNRNGQSFWRYAGIFFAVIISLAIFLFRDQLKAVGHTVIGGYFL
jgi:hypothetical protein